MLNTEVRSTSTAWSFAYATDGYRINVSVVYYLRQATLQIDYLALRYKQVPQMCKRDIIQPFKKNHVCLDL